ncbi:MAG: hypothetical protein ACKO7N_11355 [Candidatus Nitrosotenuis sp.]
MVLKSFEIDWEGHKETIEYESDLTFGEIESIMSSCVDMTNINDIKVKIPQYRTFIFLKTLRKAPFRINDSGTMKGLKNSVVEQILKGLMSDFPLGAFLEKWVASIVGEVEPVNSSTISLPQNSDGIKPQ